MPTNASERPSQQPTTENERRVVRDYADAHVAARTELDPLLGTFLGTRIDEDRLTDLSPEGHQAREELARATLAGLTALVPDGPRERRCAQLLRERLSAELAISESGEHLRAVNTMLGPPQRIRTIFTMMPTSTVADWAVIARRMARVPDALAGYADSLRAGARRGLLAAPRQVRALAEQLRVWAAAGNGQGWFAEFAAPADVPVPLRADLDRSATAANKALDRLVRFLVDDYLPLTDRTPDGVGMERYRLWARHWTGANLDPVATYEWGWTEYQHYAEQVRAEADRVQPGGSVADAMAHLNKHGTVIDGVAGIQAWLQDFIDQRIADLDGTHFDLADPVRTLQACIAPTGTPGGPYYLRPSRDFSRPGRTYLPTRGRTRFRVWNLVSTWHHEGVPGHHLQYGQWTILSSGPAPALSTYQNGVGTVSACSEGWALYAERLMDELGYLTEPGARLGYLHAQLGRAMRVVVDIGLHLGLRVPAGAPVGAGQTWTAELAEEFLVAHSVSRAFAAGEVVRYLGHPGQAISYSVGQHAWLSGREAARQAAGSGFDLKSWHSAALSLGCLGLDDLTTELCRIGVSLIT